MPKPCVGQVKWAFNHCPQSAATVEWDWLNFFWEITNDSLTALSIDDLALVYRQACTGGSGNCNGSIPLSFGTLNAATGGLTFSQRDNFNSAGPNYGVDY